MVKKLQRKLDRAIIDARIKKSEILSGEFLKKEDGMETLETILLVVVSIIVVGVIIETVKQVESQMLVRNYKGFLND